MYLILRSLKKYTGTYCFEIFGKNAFESKRSRKTIPSFVSGSATMIVVKDGLYHALKQTRKCAVGDCYYRFQVVSNLGVPGDKFTEDMVQFIIKSSLREKEIFHSALMDWIFEKHVEKSRNMVVVEFAQAVADNVYAVYPNAYQDESGSPPDPCDAGFVERCDQLGSLHAGGKNWKYYSSLCL